MSDHDSAIAEHNESQTNDPNASTVLEVLEVHMKCRKDELVQDIKQGTTQYNHDWASKVFDGPRSATEHVAYLSDPTTGAEIGQCQMFINLNSHTSYLELRKSRSDTSTGSYKVSIKINFNSLKHIKAADVRRATQELLPQEIKNHIKNLDPNLKQSIARIEQEASLTNTNLPILAYVGFDCSLAAQERIFIGTPSWAKDFTRLVKQQYVRMILADDAQTVSVLKRFSEVSAYQTLFEPDLQWRAVMAAPQPWNQPFLQRYHFDACPTFHGWFDFDFVMIYGPRLEHRFRRHMIEQYTRGKHELRMVEISGTEPQAYYGFIPAPRDELLRFTSRTKISIKFEDMKPGELQDVWSAQIAEAVPFGPDGMLPLILTRRRTSPGQRQTIRDAPNGDISQIYRSLEHVSISVTEPDLGFEECSSAVAIIEDALYAENTSWRGRVNRLLIGSDLHTLPVVDIFQAIRSEMPNPEAIMDINPAQVRAIRAAQQSLGGFQFIKGPPGTGKTHYAAEFAKVFFLAKERHLVLVISQTNRSADTLARSLQSRLDETQQAGDIDGFRYVLRLHSKGSEVSIAHSRIPGKRTQKPVPLVSTAQNELDRVKEYIREHYLKQTRREYVGIDDHRVQELELSAGWRMLQVAGLLGQSYIASQDYGRWKHFRSLYTEYRSNGGNFNDENDHRAFRAQTNALFKEVLQRASAIVTTTSNAGFAHVQKIIRDHVSLIIFDEAGREREDSIIPILATQFKKASGMITIGDPEQLKPRVDCPKEKNPFVEQLEMSFLERMARLGFELFTFTLQYRMVPEISAIPNQLTYDNQLEDHESVQIHNRPIAREFRIFTHEITGKQSNVLFLDVQPSSVNVTKADHTRSRYNELMLVFVGNMLPVILKKFPGANIGVLTAYTAQSSRLDSIVTTMQVAGVEGVDRVHVGRFEGEQGEQYDVVILDILVADTVGFLSDKRRMNVAMSRARDGLIILGDSDRISKSRDDAPYLRSLMRLLRQYAVATGRYEQFPGCKSYQPEYFMSEPTTLAGPDNYIPYDRLASLTLEAEDNGSDGKAKLRALLSGDAIVDKCLDGTV